MNGATVTGPSSAGDGEMLAATCRAALRRFASGVAVLTIADERGPHGTTVSALTAVSRQPLLVAICLREGSAFLARVCERQWFSVSVLNHRQAALARWFADPARPDGHAQFADVLCGHDQLTGAPVIEDALARLTCRLEECVPAGDHVLLLAGVADGVAGIGAPLLSVGGVLHEGPPLDSVAATASSRVGAARTTSHSERSARS